MMSPFLRLDLPSLAAAAQGSRSERGFIVPCSAFTFPVWQVFSHMNLLKSPDPPP